MAVRAVLFDFGGVLLETPLQVFAEHERRRGLPAGVINAAVAAGGERGAWARLERGELDLPGFVAAFADELRATGAEVDTAELMDEVGAMRPRPAMLDAVGRARRVAKTGLITNNWAHPGLDQALDAVRPLFDVVIESWREGLRKPDPRMYELASRRLGVRAEETVFLDDLGSNLKPARALGMTTIKVTDPAAAVVALDEVLRGAGGGGGAQG